MKKVFNVAVVKQAMKRLKISQQDIANYLAENEIPTPIDTIKSWFRADEKRRNTPELPKIKLLGQLLKLDANDMIVGYSDNITVKRVPVVGGASCGIPSPSAMQETNVFTYCSASDYNDEVYAIIANGDSMSPEIDDGDEVICDPKSTILNGDIVHYHIGNDSAIKVYVKRGDSLRLVSLNRSYGFLEFSEAECEVQGFRAIKVIKINKSVKNGRQARLKNIGEF